MVEVELDLVLWTLYKSTTDATKAFAISRQNSKDKIPLRARSANPRQSLDKF